MPQKIIIDADPGIGDAVAIALALHDPALEVVGLTATAGAVSGREASRNSQTIVEQLDPGRWPRLGCVDTPKPMVTLNDPAAVVGTPAMNGLAGLGNQDITVAELHHPHDSAKLMIDLVRSNPYEITLLTLGPLTNLEMACERAPEFLATLNGLVCLGGTVAAGGDITPSGEFNICADPEAARSVLLSPATKTLVPLDASNDVELTFEQFDRFVPQSSSRLGNFLGQILPFAFRAYHEHLGLEGIRLNEVAALAAVSKPSLVTTRSMVLDIEIDGKLTRGMTVFDRRAESRRQPNIDVVADVNPQGVLDYFCDVVAGG